MRWSSNERLTLLNKMMKLASAVYNVQYRKVRCLKSRVKRSCTSAGGEYTCRYLVFCILRQSLFLNMQRDNLYLSLLFTLFYWGGVTGTSFIDRSLKGVLGGQSGFPLLMTAYSGRVRDKDLVKFLCLYGEPLLTPSAGWRWLLSRTAWRRRRVSPRSLVASCWRPEPFTGCFRVLARLRLLWRTAGDIQNYWRAVRTWNAGSCSSFLQFCPYVY